MLPTDAEVGFEPMLIYATSYVNSYSTEDRNHADAGQSCRSGCTQKLPGRLGRSVYVKKENYISNGTSTRSRSVTRQAVLTW